MRFPRVTGYRVEPPNDRLEADFDEDHVLELTPELVGSSQVRNSGIVGEDVELTLHHLEGTRTNEILYHLTKRLIYTKWRDAGEAPKLHLFGQLKRISRQWLETCLVCHGGTYPAQLLYLQLLDWACDRITAAIVKAKAGDGIVKAVLNPYNPVGTTADVDFYTSKTLRHRTDPRRSHVNWAVLDSSWEGEFCRVVEGHPQVLAYVKNHNLGFTVPYRQGMENRTYVPDFIVAVDDGRGPDDPLNLVVEIKGYRGEDAKDKKKTMDSYWVPGVNNLGSFGRWAFAEFRDVLEMRSPTSTTRCGFGTVSTTSFVFVSRATPQRSRRRSSFAWAVPIRTPRFRRASAPGRSGGDSRGHIRVDPTPRSVQSNLGLSRVPWRRLRS